MFAALFGFALVVIAVLSYLLWEASDDRKFYRAEYKKAWAIIGEHADKERLNDKIAKDRIDFDARIQKELKDRADAIAKLKAESDHNYNEGKAAQMELARLRERLNCLLAEEVRGGVRIVTDPPKGWDVLKVCS